MELEINKMMIEAMVSEEKIDNRPVATDLQKRFICKHSNKLGREDKLEIGQVIIAGEGPEIIRESRDGVCVNLDLLSGDTIYKIYVIVNRKLIALNGISSAGNYT